MVGWLQQLRRWIRRLFRPTKKHASAPTILKRWYGKYCAVLRLERTTPGAIATYRITSVNGNDYLITLDYLPDLYGEVLGEYNGEIIKLGSVDYQNYPTTHRFAVFCIRHNGTSLPIGIWDVDLQGGYTKSYALRELAPKRAVAGVALQTLQITGSTKTPAMTWQAQMERMDWLGLLTERIRGELSNPTHNLMSREIYYQQLT